MKIEKGICLLVRVKNTSIHTIKLKLIDLDQLSTALVVKITELCIFL